uniref:Nuclear egress membrane protein n=1 Tax=Lemniscomys rat herpesvirus TaxID=3141920 RepID=A0AAU7E1Z9_9VIRU
MEIDRALHADLIAITRRILRLGDNELRVTDSALICKNPNYSLCDAMLKTDVTYCLEYLLSCWESRTKQTACFVFKNTGCRVSLCCYVRAPAKLTGLDRVKDFNFLRVNQSLIVTLQDIEYIKPCAQGVLTNCVVRRSNCGLSYNIEVVAFGPENEAEYENLLYDIYLKSKLVRGERVDPVSDDSESELRVPARYRFSRTRRCLPPVRLCRYPRYRREYGSLGLGRSLVTKRFSIFDPVRRRVVLSVVSVVAVVILTAVVCGYVFSKASP